MQEMISIIRIILFIIKSKIYWAVWGWLEKIKNNREQKKRWKDGYWS